MFLWLMSSSYFVHLQSLKNLSYAWEGIGLLVLWIQTSLVLPIMNSVLLPGVNLKSCKCGVFNTDLPIREQKF